MEIECLVSDKRMFFCADTGLVMHFTDRRWYISEPLVHGSTAVEAQNCTYMRDGAAYVDCYEKKIGECWAPNVLKTVVGVLERGGDQT